MAQCDLHSTSSSERNNELRNDHRLPGNLVQFASFRTSSAVSSAFVLSTAFKVVFGNGLTVRFHSLLSTGRLPSTLPGPPLKLFERLIWPRPERKRPPWLSPGGRGGHRADWELPGPAHSLPKGFQAAAKTAKFSDDWQPSVIFSCTQTARLLSRDVDPTAGQDFLMIIWSISESLCSGVERKFSAEGLLTDFSSQTRSGPALRQRFCSGLHGPLNWSVTQHVERAHAELLIDYLCYVVEGAGHAQNGPRPMTPCTVQTCEYSILHPDMLGNN